LTASSLADLIGISRQAIYQYEASIQSPRPEITEKLANTLSMPVSYFRYANEIETGNIFYRSMSAATKADRLRGESRYRWLRMILTYLSEYLKFPDVNFPEFNIPTNPNNISDEQIEEFAVQVRSFWNLSNIPISNVILLLENNGAHVTYDELYADTLDAFSDILPIPDTPPYIILGSDKGIAVRSRFDAAHELGHKILHKNVERSALNRKADHSLMEKQAHRFAAAFLLPADAFASDFYSSNLDTLLNLKSKWKCSVAMMIKRAGDLNFISPEQEKSLWISLSRRGWKTKEPLDDEIKIEQPQLIKRAFEMLINEKVKTKQEILSQIPLSPIDIEKLAGLNQGYLTETEEEISPTVYVLRDYQKNNKDTYKPKNNGQAEIKQFRPQNKK
jgi:Zn-dependent peptidase ImmA (M78 family)/DNA-binding XRE family transcriptional regulator